MLTKSKSVLIVCILFLLFDIVFSFYQHYHTSLGGDLAQIVVIKPKQGDYQVLEDPLGLSGETYTNPNRFFAHWFTSSYFKNTPLVLQNFVSPIVSVYLASAIIKTLIQLVLVASISIFITGQISLIKPINIISAAIISPLFQTHGFNRYMGIIDQSVVYALFYAFSFCLLLLFYLPLYLKINRKIKRIKPFVFVLLLLIIPILALSGPLLPGVILIVGVLYFGNLIKTIQTTNESRKSLLIKLWKTSSTTITLFIVAILFSVYSLFIGQRNLLNPAEAIGILERYSNMPVGLFKLFTSKLGFPILFLALGINYILLRNKINFEHSKSLLKMFKWITIFSLLYLVLLPLGGYRIYRPNIIRYDTFLPITLALIFLFGSSSIYLLDNFKKRLNHIYRVFIFGIILIFINADRLRSDHFECEVEALYQLKNANYEPVKLNNNCTVMEWQILEIPEKSTLNAGLFHFWNITDKERLFYQSGY